MALFGVIVLLFLWACWTDCGMPSSIVQKLTYCLCTYKCFLSRAESPPCSLFIQIWVTITSVCYCSWVAVWSSPASARRQMGTTCHCIWQHVSSKQPESSSVTTSTTSPLWSDVDQGHQGIATWYFLKILYILLQILSYNRWLILFISKTTKIPSAKNCTTHKPSKRNILITTSCVQSKPFHGFRGIKRFYVQW